MLGRNIGKWVAVVALLVLSACATTLNDSHGYVPEDALLNEVKLGVDTKGRLWAAV